LRSFFTFGLVGAVGAARHYATLIGLVELLSFGAVAATTAGFLVGMLVNYCSITAVPFAVTSRMRSPHRSFS